MKVQQILIAVALLVAAGASAPAQKRLTLPTRPIKLNFATQPLTVTELPEQFEVLYIGRLPMSMRREWYFVIVRPKQPRRVYNKKLHQPLKNYWKGWWWFYGPAEGLVPARILGEPQTAPNGMVYIAVARGVFVLPFPFAGQLPVMPQSTSELPKATFNGHEIPDPRLPYQRH